MSVPKNEITYEEAFQKDVRELPKKVQDKLGLLIAVLGENPFDPQLHAKPLGPPLHGAFSFRITRDYRVAFEFSAPHVIKLLLADNRNRIYERLKRKLA
ncbi:MAG: hypothetical protein Q8R20_02155 [Nanoarchaeota archaeon]|nr:hypothetical protein [Nanoarchaeota archaeon]